MSEVKTKQSPVCAPSTHSIIAPGQVGRKRESVPVNENHGGLPLRPGGPVESTESEPSADPAALHGLLHLLPKDQEFLKPGGRHSSG